LNGLHDRQPLTVGFARKDVFPLLTSHRLVVDHALQALQDSGAIVERDGLLQIPARAPALSPGQAALAGKILDIYRTERFASPREDELPEKIGAPSPVIKPVLAYLLQTAQLVALSDKVLLHQDCMAESKERLVAYLQEHGSMESAVFKDVIGATRKYVIPILEYWDAHGVTRRKGNERVLREGYHGS
jgi:selenocysteine-specific elongation factor